MSEASSSANTPQHRPVRVRFAPSPTGRMHMGSGRTALYNFLLARQTGGQFILRIEDTDQKRFVESAEAELIEGMRWLGLEWDEGPDIGGKYGPYRQSEREARYKAYAEQLIEKGHAFYCFCSPEHLDAVRKQQIAEKKQSHYDGTCRNLPLEEARRRVANGERHVVRFKTPQEGSTTVYDHLRGEITVENALIDDAVLIKSNGLAVYHLAAMADDHDMHITHVFRGAEWLPSFPLHALIMRAFGWNEPDFVHLSLFLKPSGKGKMSKRESADLLKEGKSIFITDLRDIGYPPEAVVNWMALMGWSYDGSTEFFTMQDLIEKFSLDSLNPAPAAINFEKLDHFSGLHIRAMAAEDLAARLVPFFEAEGYHPTPEKLLQIVPLIQVRLTTFDDAVGMAGFFFRDEVSVNPADLVAKGLNEAQSLDSASRSLALLQNLEEITPETAEAPMRELVEELGYSAGQVFGILRIAVTGQRVSPPLFESMEILGREKVIERLESAVRALRLLVQQQE